MYKIFLECNVGKDFYIVSIEVNATSK